MSTKLNISAVISENDKEAIKLNLTNSKELLPFLINLTPKERKGFGFGQSSVGYVQLALQIAKNHPKILPGTFDISEFEKDVKLASDLLEIKVVLLPLAEGVSDTLIAVGKEIMKQAGIIYKRVQEESKVDSNMEELRKQLAQRFTKAKAESKQKKTTS